MHHSRRAFLTHLGALTIGFQIIPLPGSGYPAGSQQADLPGSLRRYPEIDSWLEILENNRVRVFTGKVELGQGIGIVIRQVAAEELRCDLDMVEVCHADTGLTPNEGYTAGSGSVKASAMAVRYAAASGRQKLLEMAGARGKIAVEKLTLENGVIYDRKGKKVATVSELLSGKKWETQVAMPVTLKVREEYQYVGKPFPGNQLKPTIYGESYFINDLNFPGMLHARVLKPPVYAATLVSADKAGLPEGIDLFIDGSFIAVTGKAEYAVMGAAESLAKKLEWKTEPFPCTHEDLPEYIVQISDTTESVTDSGVVDEAGCTVVTGSFYKPYIMHGSMAPACGIARYDDGRLQVWSHSQGVYPLRSALAAMTGMAEEDIRVIGVPGAGCFGHNSSDDAAAEAAILARAYPGKHIRVQWSRYDEHRWEALGSAMLMEVRAGVDPEGKIRFWRSGIWTDSHSQRPNSDPGTLLPSRYIAAAMTLQGRGYLGGGYRNAEPYYQIPARKVDAHFFSGPLRVSSLRSLGAFANVFAIESMVEEMAGKVNLHPLDFRIRNLDDQRAIAVLQSLKEMTAGVLPREGEGLGFGFSRYKNNDGYCAVATLVRAKEAGQPVVVKMWAVADAGEIMNYAGLQKQIEGGMLQALSWTLKEEVRFDRQRLKSIDWVRYPILRYGESPEVEVRLLDYPDEPALGGGEMAVPPTPASITNAIFQATGVRIYHLPVLKV